MSKRLTLLFTLFVALGIGRLAAQELEFKSFELKVMDAAAKTHTVLDLNGDPCALLRVFVAVDDADFKGSLGILEDSGQRAPKRNDNNIEGNIGIRGEAKKIRNSEYVMYIPANSKSITVQGSGFLPFTYTFNQKIEGLRTYELYLRVPETGPKKHTIASNFVRIDVTPANATVLIDGVMQPLQNGSLSAELSLGSHTYQVAAPQYHGQTGTFDLVASSETLRLNIDLKPAFGWLDVTTTTPNTQVMIDGEIKGTAPCKIKLESGNYFIQLLSEGYIAYGQNISITDGMTLPVRTTLKANFAQITIKAPHAHSEIWLRGEKVGTGSWSGRLNAGTYAVESRTEGYENCKENIEVVAETPRTYTLQSPTPIYGMVKINSTPFDATIRLDGKEVGKTPWQSNEVLVGKHTLELSAEGYDTHHETITLTRDAIQSINPTLKKKAATTSSTGTTTAGTGTSSFASVPSSGTTCDADKFFPIFGNIILGKTTKEDFQRMGHTVENKEDGDWVSRVNDWYFWSHDGDKITEHIYATISYGYKNDSDGMPKSWGEMGMSWMLSYNDWVKLFTQWGFNVEKGSIKTGSFSGRKCLDADLKATSKDNTISFDLNFNYGNDFGEGYSTSSRRSLYSMTINVKQGQVNGSGSSNNSSSNISANTSSTTKRSGTGLTYDDLFPLYGVSLDKSTQADLRRMGHKVEDKQDGDFVCWINSARFWTFDDDSNIFEQVSISASALPDPWKELGFDASLSDEQFAVLLKEYGFEVKWLKKSGKPYVKALSSDGKVLLELKFDESGKLDELTARTQGTNSNFDWVWRSEGDSGTEKTVPASTSKSSAYNTRSSYTYNSTSSSTEMTYKVGDYYNENGKEGVVFEVDATGKHGKIVSLRDTYNEWTTNDKEQKRLIGANDKYDGRKNMEVIKRISNWRSIYPAFAWCEDLGKDWYIPAIEELKKFTLDKSIRDTINKTLSQYGETIVPETGIFSSTESGDKYSGVYQVFYVYPSKGNGSYGGFENDQCKYVDSDFRAIARF